MSVRGRIQKLLPTWNRFFRGKLFLVEKGELIRENSGNESPEATCDFILNENHTSMRPKNMFIESKPMEREGVKSGVKLMSFLLLYQFNRMVNFSFLREKLVLLLNVTWTTRPGAAATTTTTIRICTVTTANYGFWKVLHGFCGRSKSLDNEQPRIVINTGDQVQISFSRSSESIWWPGWDELGRVTHLDWTSGLF